MSAGTCVRIVTSLSEENDSSDLSEEFWFLLLWRGGNRNGKGQIRFVFRREPVEEA